LLWHSFPIRRSSDLIPGIIIVAASSVGLARQVPIIVALRRRPPTTPRGTSAG
jgi:hypothetical protein